MPDYIQIITGVLSGGSAAFGSFAAVFRSIKLRLDALEEKLGSDTRPKTGMFLVVERMDETVQKLKKELDRWPDDPPDWLVRLIKRTMASNSMSLDLTTELERTAEQRYRTIHTHLNHLEERLDTLQTSLKAYIARGEYERDTRKRSEELSKIRVELATSNGLLRGVMSALGYIDPKRG